MPISDCRLFSCYINLQPTITSVVTAQYITGEFPAKDVFKYLKTEII